MLFKRVPWRTFSKDANNAPVEENKTLIVRRPTKSVDSIVLPGARSSVSKHGTRSEESISIQRPRRSSSVIVPSVENETSGALLDHAVEEAVADPGLSVELDLSETTVGLRGRDEPMKMLEEALEPHLPLLLDGRTVKSNNQANSETDSGSMTAVLVSGGSGTGKTSLIRQFASLHQHKILYGAGKFDQIQSFDCEGPYGVLLKALQSVVQQILDTTSSNESENNSTIGVTRKILRRILDDHLTPSQRSCIQELIPNSSELWGNNTMHSISENSVDTETDTSSSKGGLQRHEVWNDREELVGEEETLGQEPHFAFHLSRVTMALRAFLVALVSTERPLVLFLDDLQWADKQALVSISSLLAEFSASSISNTTYFTNNEAPLRQQTNDSPLSRTGSNKEINASKRLKKNLVVVGVYRSSDRSQVASNKIGSIDIDENNDRVPEGDFNSLSSVDNSVDSTEWFLNNLSPDRVIRIHLEPLGFSTTHEIINAALKLDSERTQSLADVVFRKTSGNPYFVLRYLEMLHRERLLFYSFSTYQWHWNLDLIQTETNVTDNVVGVLSRHVERLPEEIQAVLRLAACLGFYFDIIVLREIVLREGILSDAARQSRFNSRVHKMQAAREEDRHKLSLRSRRSSIATSKYGKLMGSRYDPVIWQSEQRENEKICAAWLVYVLGRAEREGLIERASNKQFKFSHDRVQRCLYDATPPGKPRDLLHLRIGRLVRDTYLACLDDENPRSQNAMLFFAVEQLNMSSSYIKDVEERIGLVELNLDASDKAGEHMTFLAAARFLRKAQTLIRDEDWDERYDMCLEVYSSVAEVEHSCGNSFEAMEAVEVIFERARSFEDKIRGVFIKVNGLGVQGRLGEAIKEGCDALDLLGEGLPSKLGSFNALKEIQKLNKAFKKLSKTEVWNLPEMTDPSKKAAMSLLNSLSIFAWHAAEDSLVTVIFLRLMSITLKHGQDQYTPFTFATFAMLLASHGDTNSATEFGKLALEMLSRSKSIVALPRTHLIIYTFINHIRQPLMHSVEPLLNAHRMGLENGELEYGSLATASYASLYVIFGLPLSNFSTDMRTISEQLSHFHQNIALASLLPWWQFGMNLMGDCDDVLNLTGDAMEEEDYRTNVAGKAPERTLNFVRLMLFFLFDELELAMNEYEKIKDFQKATLTNTHFMNHFQHCYCGLLNLSMARSSSKPKYKKNAKIHISELDKLVRSGALNCQHMLVILKAEECALSGNPAKAKEMYDAALSICARSGFVHLQAITNEKAGLFMHEKGDSFWAATYLSQALRNYAEWGADAKVQSLLSKCEDLGLRQSLDFSRASPQYNHSLKGRTRFKSTPSRLRASFQG